MKHVLCENTVSQKEEEITDLPHENDMDEDSKIVANIDAGKGESIDETTDDSAKLGTDIKNKIVEEGVDMKDEHILTYQHAVHSPVGQNQSRNSNTSPSASIFDDLRASAPNVVDPLFLVSQLHIASNETLRLIPSDSNTLKRALAVLDRTPCAETHKIGFLRMYRKYVNLPGKCLILDILVRYGLHQP